MKLQLKVNGAPLAVDADGDMPLLWVLRDYLGQTGTKFGCGMGLCGACTVHVDGKATRSCVTPVGTVLDADITTIEGLSKDGTHPVQAAWIAEQVPQCGYCQSGMIMAACALLQENPAPTRQDIRDGIGNLCRCGTYPRVERAILRVAAATNGGQS
ncbi:(2Fe-2S)-binding protein [Pigmentiphaga sp. GD03639]|uniref:(2Fe-2S)-binding protein n=1 Tax=Pigmentiphaga sp. GD03639 TaxID=2975354 RepID=UPI0024476D6F|nr:(2Fe-2S)-binding protein [Pigmentiphaga sp. GD03639]MDH2235054.1 (2Fe-2S)-binding protein [Pigmentiphaga sp. GD03639]